MEVRISQSKLHKERILFCREGESLLELLRRERLLVPADCGGHGTCGKCKVQVLSGAPAPTLREGEIFTKEQLDGGYRLACSLSVRSDLVLAGEEILQAEAALELEKTPKEEGVRPHAETSRADTGRPETERPETERLKTERPETERTKTGRDFALAIDLGTTTLAFRLMDREGHRLGEDLVLPNSQRMYGADVISRITAAQEGRGGMLRSHILGDLNRGIDLLLQREGFPADGLSHVGIAGNTTMIHLLLGYDCSGLGSYPFQPAALEYPVLSGRKALGREQLSSTLVYFVPGLSAFVGGDIVAGLRWLMDKEEDGDLRLLLDLGTNGEMVLWNRDRMVVTSAAAGPALEGGQLSCGMSAVDGAVVDVDVCGQSGRQDQGAGAGESRATGERNGSYVNLSYRILGDGPCKGICGSGVIALMAALLEAGTMDETGLLADPYFEKGLPLGMGAGSLPRLTQQDVRQIQLAGSAIRTGIELLLERMGFSCHQVCRVYLAGSFGHHLSGEKAARMGLLPAPLAAHAKAVGNTSLEGAALWCERLFEKEEAVAAKTSAEGMLGRSVEEVILAKEPSFQERFLGNLNFPGRG